VAGTPDFGLTDVDEDQLVFRGLDGELHKYASFWERWNLAVAKVKKQGLLPVWKMPTFHDLRHSRVAALLSDGRSLTCVQRRLGHESIKTMSDRYGHLLESAHTAALVTIHRVMGHALPEADTLLEAVPREGAERPVQWRTSASIECRSGSRTMPRPQQSAGHARGEGRRTSSG
jgi:hypothetical protein